MVTKPKLARYKNRTSILEILDDLGVLHQKVLLAVLEARVSFVPGRN